MFDFILRPLRRNFGRDKAYYKVVDDMFGFIPNNIELYKLALIHKSASLVLEDGRPINNERLEFLGDAVIEAVTSDYLFIEYPDRDEAVAQRVGRENRPGSACHLERQYEHYPETHLRRCLRSDDRRRLPRPGI